MEMYSATESKNIGSNTDVLHRFIHFRREIGNRLAESHIRSL